MNGRHHAAIAIASWVAAAPYLPGDLAAPFAGPLGYAGGLLLCWLGGLLPDLDTPTSKMGRCLPGLSHAVHWLFGHRGFTHSLLLPLSVVIAFELLQQPLPLSWLLPLAIGWSSHIIADMFTPAGVPVLLPVVVKFKLPLASNDLYERGITGVLVVLLLSVGLLPDALLTDLHAAFSRALPI
ncbi:metal-dependent hydrolase [Ferrimonas senticii]|uniref:metal-dependent hydrolase n=1 Tax=Ferrimonas senticii TaxID=394566 RepID=UPI0003FFB8DC|nr:metal-dependent hydrolase [Ferrimonas senticii]